MKQIKKSQFMKALICLLLILFIDFFLKNLPDYIRVIYNFFNK